jgi:hypothetical protein
MRRAVWIEWHEGIPVRTGSWPPAEEQVERRMHTNDSAVRVAIANDTSTEIIVELMAYLYCG